MQAGFWDSGVIYGCKHQGVDRPQRRDPVGNSEPTAQRDPLGHLDYLWVKARSYSDLTVVPCLGQRVGNGAARLGEIGAGAGIAAAGGDKLVRDHVMPLVVYLQNAAPPTG